MLMIFRSTSDRVDQLPCMTAASVLTGGAEPREGDRCAARTSLGLIGQDDLPLTGWTDCQMAAADVLIGGAEPRGKVLQFGLTIFRIAA